MENRSIGLYEGIALYIAAILGSGVLFISSVTASIAGPASILSWIIVILANLPLAYTFACLAREYPDAGGAATFVRKSFGFHFGNIVGWFYFVTAAVGQTIVALTGAYYMSQAFGFSDWGRILLAFFILITAGITNYNGVKVSGKVALLLSGCLLLMLTVSIIISIPNITLERFAPLAPNGWYSIGTAITAIFWAFFGWEAICNLANHFKRPEKNIVHSTIISVIIIGILFLSLSFITIGTGTYGNIESDSSPIGAIMGETLGIGAQMVTAVMAFFICIGTSNAFVASLTQLGYALSRDGAFPKKLSTMHPTKQIPRRMVVFVIAFACIGVIITEYFTMTFQDILFIPTSLGVFVYLFSMAAGVKLFTSKTLPWYSAVISLVFCILVLPFFQLYIFVPIIVIILYGSYMTFQKRVLSWKASRRNERVSSMESNNLFSLEEKWKAIVTCDHSFDGKFFYAVKTTGIFCRPSCKSKTPHYKNICFFNHAREAIQQGFRPCKRCRPELLIDSYDPQQEIVEKTKFFLEKNYEEKITLETLAVIIGVSPYHLSRTFKEHTGTSPHEYLEQLRIQKAKDLLMNTDHNVTEICFQIGYKNLSSFYKHFKKNCDCSPHQFRMNQTR